MASKAVKALIKKLKKLGLEVMKTKSGHFKVVTAKGNVILPSTASDHRALLNVTSELRRRGVDVKKMAVAEWVALEEMDAGEARHHLKKSYAGVQAHHAREWAKIWNDELERTGSRHRAFLAANRWARDEAHLKAKEPEPVARPQEPVEEPERSRRGPGQGDLFQGRRRRQEGRLWRLRIAISEARGTRGASCDDG